MQTPAIQTKNKIWQGFLNIMKNKVRQMVEPSEQPPKKTLGDAEPKTNNLDIARADSMNTSSEIEEQFSKSINKLNPESVNQLLEVLSIIRRSSPRHRFEILMAYQKAVKDVSAKHNINRTSIADLCTRRLGSTGKGARFKFVDLIEDWLMKGGVALQSRIKTHTYDHQHQKIAEFFGNGGIIR